jgi:hypothetical protein
MTFAEFAQYLKKLEEQSSRLEMTYLLAELYARLDVGFLQEESNSEIQISTYLMQGSLVPEYQSLEFNLSTKMLQRVLVRVLQTTQNKTQTTDLFGEVSEGDDQARSS